MAPLPFSRRPKDTGEQDAPGSPNEVAQFFSNDPRPDEQSAELAPSDPVRALQVPAVAMQEHADAGWYPDATDPGLMRYWDGFHLTGQVMHVHSRAGDDEVPTPALPTMDADGPSFELPPRTSGSFAPSRTQLVPLADQRAVDRRVEEIAAYPPAPVQGGPEAFGEPTAAGGLARSLPVRPLDLGDTGPDAPTLGHAEAASVDDDDAAALRGPGQPADAEADGVDVEGIGDRDQTGEAAVEAEAEAAVGAEAEAAVEAPGDAVVGTAGEGAGGDDRGTAGGGSDAAPARNAVGPSGASNGAFPAASGALNGTDSGATSGSANGAAREVAGKAPDRSSRSVIAPKARPSGDHDQRSKVVEDEADNWAIETERAVSRARKVGTPEAWQEAAMAAAVVSEVAQTMQATADAMQASVKMAEAASKAAEAAKVAEQAEADAVRAVEETTEAARKAAEAARVAEQAAGDAKQVAERTAQATPKFAESARTAQQCAADAELKAKGLDEIVTEARKVNSPEAWSKALELATRAIAHQADPLPVAEEQFARIQTPSMDWATPDTVGPDAPSPTSGVPQVSRQARP